MEDFNTERSEREATHAEKERLKHELSEAKAAIRGYQEQLTEVINQPSNQLINQSIDGSVEHVNVLLVSQWTISRSVNQPNCPLPTSLSVNLWLIDNWLIN